MNATKNDNTDLKTNSAECIPIEALIQELKRQKHLLHRIQIAFGAGFLFVCVLLAILSHRIISTAKPNHVLQDAALVMKTHLPKEELIMSAQAIANEYINQTQQHLSAAWPELMKNSKMEYRLLKQRIIRFTKAKISQSHYQIEPHIWTSITHPDMADKLTNPKHREAVATYFKHSLHATILNNLDKQLLLGDELIEFLDEDFQKMSADIEKKEPPLNILFTKLANTGHSFINYYDNGVKNEN